MCEGLVSQAYIICPETVRHVYVGLNFEWLQIDSLDIAEQTIDCPECEGVRRKVHGRDTEQKTRKHDEQHAVVLGSVESRPRRIRDGGVQGG